MKILIWLLILFFSLETNLAYAKNIHRKQHIKKARVRVLTINKILKGSITSRLRQNQVADEEGLERIVNDEELQKLKDNGSLLPLPSDFIKINKNQVQSKNQWCRPWTQKFILNELTSDFQINSAVRTIRDQNELRKINRNAITPYGPLATSHIRGSTIDIAKKIDKKNIPPKLINWLRNKLIELEKAGVIEATEERQQPVFHVMVFKKYSEYVSKMAAIKSNVN